MKKLALILTLIISHSVLSFEKDGIKFDDKIKVDNTDLILNGVGIRRATIFKVKVYYGGLYLDKKTNDVDTILKSSTPKEIIMNFVHDVDHKKLANGFSDGLKAANKDASKFKLSFEKFQANLQDMQKGEKIIIQFFADGIAMNVKGKSFEKISDAEFSKALLSIWFINVADEGLKEGLLSL